MADGFVHLHCHSEYSMLDGAARLKDLVKGCEQMGMSALAVTDHGNLFGAYEWYKVAKGSAVKPIIGLEAYLTPKTPRGERKRVQFGDGTGDDVASKGAYTHMTIWAENSAGMHNLFRLSSRSSLEGFFYKPRADRELLNEYKSGLIATTGCPSGEVQTYLRLGQYDQALASAAEFRDIFGAGNFYVELMDHGLAIERRVRHDLLRIAKDLKLPLVATNDLHYVHADDAEAHDTLLCVSSGSNRDTPNRFKFDGNGYYLKSPAEMRRIWAELPEACDNTLAIAERCETHFDEGTGTYMAQFPVPAGETEESWFAKEVRHGLEVRFPEGVPSYATEQAEFETKVITDKGYCFPPGTQVLLGDGTWRPIESIRVGDEITSVSTWNLKGRPAVVEDVISRVVDEEICVIHPFGQTNEVRATAEHPFLVDSKGWVPASQVQPGDWLLLPQAEPPTYAPFDLEAAAVARGWTLSHGEDQSFTRMCTSDVRSPRPASGSLPCLVEWSADLMWLIGLWVAEGHLIDPSAPTSPGQIGWTLHRDEPAVSRLMQTIESLKLGEPRLYSKASDCAPNHQSVTVMLTNHPLALLLQELVGCGVRNKKLHPWISSLPESGIRSFISGWLEGDGHADRTRVGITTVNDVLARQLRSLLLSIGQWAVVDRSPSQKTWKVQWIPTRTKAPDNARNVDGRWWVRVRATARQAYQGTVHNLTVSGDHTYVAEGIAVHNCGYFLVVADFINWAKNNGIRVGPGRGSGAGSMCAYALRITDLDPVPHGLIFERFLNPERPSMPDFDIDFDERRRGEVIRYVTEKYGDDHVCQIVTYGTIKAKQAIKDAGRVLGKPFGLGEKITKAYTPPVMGKDVPLPEVFNPQHARYAEGGEFRALYESDPEVQEVVDTARGIEGLKRQWGVHAAGVIMSSAPLLDVIPVMKREADGQIITQFDYPSCEALGLVKMDFLGLRNLTILDDALANVKANRGVDLDLDALSKNPTDPSTYQLLATGDTLGIFQLDGGGMRVLLRQMQPDNFEDISAALALYRPGPMGANSHTNYALRKTGKQPITAIHPELAEPLAEILDLTYGLIVYQEQVQQIAVKVANYTLGAADELRRAMGKKKKEVLEKEYDRFAAGMTANGYSSGAIKSLWDILVPFSDYAFNKAHTAAYGLISYWTAYLKANYPAEYMAALLQSVKDDKDKSAVYLAECRRMGIKVLPPDVNESDGMFTPVGTDIRYGLGAIRNVGDNVVNGIVAGRDEHGKAHDFNEFLSNVPLVVCNKRVIESLIKAGAFDSLGHTRRSLMECYEQKVDEVIDLKRNQANGQDDLFGDAGDGEALVSSPIPQVDEWDKRVRLAFEREMLGLYVSDHPLLGLEHVLLANRDHSIGALVAEDGPRDITTSIAGMITQVTRKQTKTGDLWAIVTVEDLEASIEVLLFPKAYQLVALQLATDTIVRIKGKLVGKDEGVELRGTDVSFPDVSEGPTGPVVISLPAARCTPAVVQQLRTVLTNHPGATEVRVRLTTSSNRTTVWKLEETLRVMPSPPLMADLKALLGPSCV